MSDRDAGGNVKLNLDGATHTQTNIIAQMAGASTTDLCHRFEPRSTRDLVPVPFTL